MPMRISVVVPVYNSESSLRQLIEQLKPVLDSVTDEYELVLVNDGSRDSSWQVIQSLAAEYPFVRGINLMRNYGQHNALLCALRAVRYPVTITMDDDLQHPPEEIPKLLEEFNKGFDLVYGTPREERHGLLRDLASVFTKLALQSAMGVDIARKVGPFRVFRTDLRKAFDKYSGSFISIDVLLTWGTTNVGAVAVRHEERKYGASNYTVKKLIMHAFNMMTGFSALPLQIASMAGFAFTLFGFVLLAYTLIRYALASNVVPGFAFLASSIAIFSGVQLFSLGIIGEYLARMHFRMLDKPQYTIENETEIKTGSTGR